ncbi:MAG TPA: hypothetical protein VFZ78_06960 [Flavisolibacter sp.]
MESNQSYRIDPGELEDVISAIERFYDIRLPGATEHFTSYQQLREVILQKIEEKDPSLVTGQQMFSAVRKAIVAITGAAEENVQPSSPLASLFPVNQRKKKVRQLGKALGVKLDILTNSSMFLVVMLILLVTSAALVFFHFYALYLMAASVVGIILGLWFGNDFTDDARTVADLSLKLASETRLRAIRRQLESRPRIRKEIAGFFTRRMDVPETRLSKLEFPAYFTK